MTQPNDPGTTFECRSCGAKLVFDAASQAMKCPFCTAKEAVQAAAPAQAAQALREIPIEEGLARATRGLGTQGSSVGCRDCGATVNVGPNEQTVKCSFCGSQQVLQQPADPNLIRPESLVPFKIPKEQGHDLFSKWVRSLWFRPSNLKHMAKVQEINGLYVPFWTFDSLVTSQWTAERGWHYTVTETYTTTENGQTVTRTRQVTHTRWESASGWRRDMFDDELVCASKGLPQNLVVKFSTFNTRELVPYQPQFLAGWRAESYAIDLMPAWQVAQQKMARTQEGRCGSDVGGDTHRYLQVHNTFGNVTFKHVLLPIWIAAYRYNGKPYRFLINGQTGEVVGEAPWSVIKIVLFILLLLAIIGGIGAGYSVYQSNRTSGSGPRATTTSTVAPPAQPPPRNTQPTRPPTTKGR
ncbi:MAG: hypothetical protein HY898_00140 [Deltaproteobacteria bacterium]|nr:hypothetical protein [Deltaproteobacteria bacterium]